MGWGIVPLPPSCSYGPAMNRKSQYVYISKYIVSYDKVENEMLFKGLRNVKKISMRTKCQLAVSIVVY